MTQFTDDYEAAPRTLQEIEELAASYVSIAGLLPGDWIDPFEFMSSLGFRDEVLSTRQMMGAHSFANARVNTISMTRQMSKGLRENNERYRHIWGHEIGHLAMHRGPGLKARVSGPRGNAVVSFIPRIKSAEFQAWLFSRALFIPRSLLRDGIYDGLDYRIGIPLFAIEKRIEDIAADDRNELFKDR
jgi:hypothetical protein